MPLALDRRARHDDGAHRSKEPTDEATCCSGCTADALTLVLTGCGAVHAVQDAVFGLNCTTVGLSEGVTVDLTGVLPFEGGSYQVTMTLPDSGGTVSGTIDPHREGPLQIGDSADLDDDPIRVRVEARDANGRLVYRGSGTQTPALDQPNGPRCR